MQQNRGSGQHGEHLARDNKVYDNQIVMAAGAMGATSRQGNARVFSQNNRFSGNHYVVRDPNAACWSWEGGLKTWAQWQAAGHDADGIVTAPAKK